MESARGGESTSADHVARAVPAGVAQPLPDVRVGLVADWPGPAVLCITAPHTVPRPAQLRSTLIDGRQIIGAISASTSERSTWVEAGGGLPPDKRQRAYRARSPVRIRYRFRGPLRLSPARHLGLASTLSAAPCG